MHCALAHAGHTARSVRCDILLLIVEEEGLRFGRQAIKFAVFFRVNLRVELELCGLGGDTGDAAHDTDAASGSASAAVHAH